MTEEKQQDSIPGQAGDTPDVEVKNKGGRPKRSHYQQPVQDIINVTAPAAALILKQHIERRRGYKTLALSLQRACEYVIDHAIGKSRQKVEHSGGIMTYGQLAKSAEALDTKPRPILADVEEIANRYSQQPAGSDKDEKP